MNSIRRFTIVGLIVALAVFMVSFSGHVNAACANLTINNWSGMGTLKMKYWSGGVLTTYTVVAGPNTFPAVALVAAQSSAGANIAMPGGCTPCYMADIAGGGTVCIASCFDPATCTVDINITPCSPTPPTCIP